MVDLGHLSKVIQPPSLDRYGNISRVALIGRCSCNNMLLPIDWQGSCSVSIAVGVGGGLERVSCRGQGLQVRGVHPRTSNPTVDAPTGQTRSPRWDPLHGPDMPRSICTQISRIRFLGTPHLVQLWRGGGLIVVTRHHHNHLWLHQDEMLNYLSVRKWLRLQPSLWPFDWLWNWAELICKKLIYNRRAPRSGHL